MADPDDDLLDALDDLRDGLGEEPALDPTEVGPDATLPHRLQAGFTGRRASFSLFTDGEESRVALDLGDGALSFAEGTAELIGSPTALDAAFAIALDAEAAVVVGDALAGGGFLVYAWHDALGRAAPVTLMVDATADVCGLVVSGVAYCPANPAERTVRWVSVPGLADYARLDEAQRRWMRAPIEAAWGRAADALPPALAELDATALAWPTLRLLVASHPGVVPIKAVSRGGVDRGGIVYGVTRSQPTRDLVEPANYVPVISLKEGNVDAINAWDLDAGVSVGPVQVNVIAGRLFSVLDRVWREDPTLFEACFGGLDWAMTERDGRPALVVEGVAVLTSKRGETRDDIRANAAYFQSGVIAGEGRQTLDGEWRRQLAARFRNLVLWPHVQAWLTAESADFLAGGARRLARSTVAPLAEGRDAFVLRALLLSGYVRYAASLKLTLPHLPKGSAKRQLAALPTALGRVAAESKAWPTRVERLQKRYFGKGGQRDDAESIYAMLH